MSSEPKKIQFTEADSFAEMHLNETGKVEDFIERLKSEIKDFETEQKKQFLHIVLRRVNKEYASHSTICSLKSCIVKEYFKECLLRLEILCELRRLN